MDCRDSVSAVRSVRIERLLFWVPFLSFAYFYQGADQSIAARFDLMRSIVERRTLWIDGYCGYNTADIISLGGHYYSVKAPGGSFTGIIQWIFWSALLSPLRANHEALYWALATWLTTLFATSLIVAISCVVMYRLILVLGGTQGRALLCALLMPFATIVFPYATEMTGEPIAGACALIAFYLLASQGDNDDMGRMMLAGMLAGWAVLCDFPALLISAALAVYALWRLRWSRRFLDFAIGAVAIALILLAYNKSAFGHPFFLSYEAYKLAGNTQFPEQAVGFVGLKYPRPDILYKILLDPQRGLFYCNPVLLLSVPAFVYMARRKNLRAGAAVAAFAALSMILFNASFGESIVSWGGGTATGPRQIVAAIPFMVIPLAFLPSRWNWPIAILGSLSAAAMVMATAVEPHFPYEYPNPLRDFALQGYLRGNFAYDRDNFFSGPAIVDQSTAFNLGKLAGLPGPFQLWPLALLWLWGAMSLLRRTRESPYTPLSHPAQRESVSGVSPRTEWVAESASSAVSCHSERGEQRVRSRTISDSFARGGAAEQAEHEQSRYRFFRPRNAPMTASPLALESSLPFEPSGHSVFNSLQAASESPQEQNFAAVRRWIAGGAIALLILLCIVPFTSRIAARFQPTPRNGLRGLYYRELRPTRFPPLVERVDRELNFSNAGELGGVPAPSRILWTGTLQAPLTGEYRFVIEADDCGWVTIDGMPVIRDPGNVTQTHDEGLVYLTQGPHRVEVGLRNLAGDAVMRLAWQPPGGELEIVPSSALHPR